MIFLGDCAELIKSLDHLPAGERKQDIHINDATAIPQDIFFFTPRHLEFVQEQ